VAHAAPLLGLRRTTLLEKLRKYGITRPLSEVEEIGEHDPGPAQES
jgi:sigma-54 specific flagellar transcriptional regulator A